MAGITKWLILIGGALLTLLSSAGLVLGFIRINESAYSGLFIMICVPFLILGLLMLGGILLASKMPVVASILLGFAGSPFIFFGFNQLQGLPIAELIYFLPGSVLLAGIYFTLTGAYKKPQES
jgi:hypothetical protein